MRREKWQHSLWLMLKKRKQAFQGMMYARLLCLGNGTLKSLHDKSKGFYRRQIIIQTKPKPANRVDDPFLKDKLIIEIPGILLWCLEGLARLVKNNYRFTISEKSAQLKAQYMEDDNNIKSFLESEGYIEFRAEAKCPTQVLYDTYARWLPQCLKCWKIKGGRERQMPGRVSAECLGKDGCRCQAKFIGFIAQISGHHVLHISRNP